ncbi:hypothetical protein FF011L_13390 [Roseimaritima multifibrata]|uniref:Uncharacterized protein n=1 Tax=Roseimaritima multifibrata TaxID=1930274 RepID=A0A517MCI0_9BACT|nr:hypothetical protein FF011L_13390 [Roseimaritima multifibrata]
MAGLVIWPICVSHNGLREQPLQAIHTIIELGWPL